MLAAQTSAANSTARIALRRIASNHYCSRKPGPLAFAPALGFQRGMKFRGEIRRGTPHRSRHVGQRDLAWTGLRRLDWWIRNAVIARALPGFDDVSRYDAGGGGKAGLRAGNPARTALHLAQVGVRMDVHLHLAEFQEPEAHQREHRA